MHTINYASIRRKSFNRHHANSFIFDILFYFDVYTYFYEIPRHDQGKYGG